MIQTDLIIEDENWRTCGDLDAICERAFAAATEQLPIEGVIAVLLTDNDALHALNAQFRGKDKPTDILSFAADEMARPQIGDLALAHGVAAKDAATRDIPLADHLTHLLIHGYLHVLGHDHEDPAEAAEMEALEINALASLGLPNPYSKP